MAGHGGSAGLGPCGVGVTTKPPTALMTFVIPRFQKTGPPPLQLPCAHVCLQWRAGWWRGK